MTFPMHKRYSNTSRQRGAALMVSMIMILLLLLLAVVAMRSVTLESRITANMLENQRMYEAADGTLREGERIILTHAFPLEKCKSTSVMDGVVPCYVSEAKADTLKLGSDFTVSAAATGLTVKPLARWYPRQIGTECPKGSSATSALNAATVGCTEYYEVNAQATELTTAQKCGPDGLCLRSSINMFVK
ncbi:pilus assembly PilX family protein [Diaphorobacter aerolatus]|uniref:Pilus assembly protein PilX n=1 Tax=Diaphorobacter aerolatus TaxID=1288495 RepID=A0A7H0GGI9_9BURK|nr:PilX N-terminal domain-containing pilus assembly protein [Diaphorobacter aerolatus]QNP47405.1 pilus assembly protein PilX [Diaphorobacter aerolatus]